MKRLAAIGLLLLALPGCMTADPIRPFPPSAYDCSVHREVAGWHLEIVRSVSVEPGRESWDQVDWRTDHSEPGVAVSFTMWPGETGPAQHGGLELSYLSRERSDERLRVEIRRRAPGGGLDNLPPLAGGGYSRDWRPSRTSLYRRQGTFNWTAVNALVRDGVSLMVVLADEDGRVFRATPFDPAWLTPPLDALAAARPELDAMAADMRNRCTPEQPIVVT